MGSIRPRATTVLKFPLARKGASTDVARIRGAGAMTPYPVLGSCDADGLRASQVQHAIEHVDRYVHLSRPTLLWVRAQSVPDHALVAADRSLSSGPFRIPRRPLPTPAALLGDELEVVIPLGRLALGCPARHGCRARRDN